MNQGLRIDRLQSSKSLVTLNTVELERVVGGAHPSLAFLPGFQRYQFIFNPNTVDGAINLSLSNAAKEFERQGNTSRANEIRDILQQRGNGMLTGDTIVNQIVFPS